MPSKTHLCRTVPDIGLRADRQVTDGLQAHASFAGLARQPWWLRVDAADLLIRPAASKDLEAIARMHSRCSARSLLDRYRAGGRAPAVAAMERMVRRPLSFVASTTRGEIVATAVAAVDQIHGAKSAEVGLLVEDDWQGLGMGRELMTHLAGAAVVYGYRDLIAYPATSVLLVQRLLIGVGRTRVVSLPDNPHVHAALSEAAVLGLGPVREQLAS